MLVECAYTGVRFTVGGFTNLRLFDASSYNIHTMRDLPLEVQAASSSAAHNIRERTSIHGKAPKDGQVSRVYTNFTSTEERLRNRPMHPFLLVDPRVLLIHAQDWAAGRLLPVERRLLFIAALRHTGLVHFQCTAIPSNGRIQRNMESVLKLLAWRESAASVIPVPEYVVNRKTRKLTNLDDWLSAVEDAKANWLSRLVTRENREKLDRLERALNKLFKQSVPTSYYGGRLAEWAIAAAEVPDYLLEKVKQVFRASKDADIFALDEEDIDLVYEHMLDNLDHGSTHTKIAIEHVRRVKRINFVGPSIRYLDYDDERPLTAAEILAAQATEGEEELYEGEIVQPALTEADKRVLAIRQSHMPAKERTTTASIIAAAPTEKPKKEDYATNTDYLRAFAQWSVANSARQQAAALEKHKQREEERAARLIEKQQEASEKSGTEHNQKSGDDNA